MPHFGCLAIPHPTKPLLAMPDRALPWLPYQAWPIQASPLPAVRSLASSVGQFVNRGKYPRKLAQKFEALAE